MSKQAPNPLYILIQFASAGYSRIQAPLQGLASLVQRLSPPVPLHWSMPLAAISAAGLEEEPLQRFLSLLMERDDRLLPLGYSGARHGFLTPEELDAEFSLARKVLDNLKSQNKLHTDETIITASQMDLCRQGITRIYAREATFILAGPSVPQEEGFSFMTSYRDGRFQSHPALHISGQTEMTLRDLKKQIRRRRGPLFLVFDGLGKNSRALLEEVLLLLSSGPRKLLRRPVETITRRRLTQDRAGEKAQPYASLVTPRDRSALIEAKRLREGKNSDQTTGDVLDLAAPNAAYRRVRTGGAALSRLKERELIANMPGTVEHTNHHYSVIFDSGRFSGFLYRGSGGFLIKRARALVETEQTSLEYRTVSAFSIEEDNLCGMREVLQAESPLPQGNPGLMTIDHLFPEGMKGMLLLVTMKYPDLPHNCRVKQFIPLDIPLFTLRKGTPLLLEGSRETGDRYQWQIPHKEGVFQLPGNNFLLSQGSLSLQVSFPQQQDKLMEGLILNLTKTKRGSLELSLCPDAGFGDVNSDEISGYETHFSLILTPVEREKDETIMEKGYEEIPFPIVQEILPRMVFRNEQR